MGQALQRILELYPLLLSLSIPGHVLKRTSPTLIIKVLFIKIKKKNLKTHYSTIGFCFVLFFYITLVNEMEMINGNVVAFSTTKGSNKQSRWLWSEISKAVNHDISPHFVRWSPQMLVTVMGSWQLFSKKFSESKLLEQGHSMTSHWTSWGHLRRIWLNRLERVHWTCFFPCRRTRAKFQHTQSLAVWTEILGNVWLKS